MDSMNTTRNCYVYSILVISLELLMLMISNISNKSKQFWKYVFKRSKVKGSHRKRAVPRLLTSCKRKIFLGRHTHIQRIMQRAKSQTRWDGLFLSYGYICPLSASWPTARWAPRRGTCWSRTAPVARRGGARSSSTSLERLSRFRHLDDPVFMQTWYLSLILLLEKKLSCGKISAFHVWQLWGNWKFHHMWRKFSTIDGVLSQFMPFCC